MTKTITFWCPFLGNVGTKKAVLQSAKALSATKNFNCKIINVFGEFDNYKKFFKQNKIEEIKLIKNRILINLPKKGFFWSRLNFILIILFGFIPLHIYLKNNKKDFLFVYLLSSLPFLVTTLFNFKNKIIFRISGRVTFSFFRKKIWSFAKNKIHKIYIQTKYSQQMLIKQKIFTRNKISFLEDPIIDIKEINKVKNQKIENKFNKKKFYVAIGRLTKQKNFKFLINSIEEIIKKNSFKLLIIGDGEEKYSLSKMIKEKNLTKKIFLIGQKNNIFKYLCKSEGLICSSLWEEPGFVIQEAAACKKIILTSNCESGPAEFLENGKHGFVFINNNKESFEKNFIKLLLNKKNHKKIIKINYKKIGKYSKNYFVNIIKKDLY